MWGTWLGFSISFVLVIILWIMQRFNRKFRLLCLCLFICFLLVSAVYIGKDFCGGRTLCETLMFNFLGYTMLPGMAILAFFVGVKRVLVEGVGLFLCIPVSLIFWALVLYGVVKFISYVKKKLSHHEMSTS